VLQRVKRYKLCRGENVTHPRGSWLTPVQSEALLPWFAIRVRSNCERNVFQALHQKGYDLFFPTYTATRQWSDRIKQLTVPLFRGYIFCRLNHQHPLPVLTTPGVVQLVGNGRTPIEVTEDEISSVKAVLNSNLPYMPYPSLACGTRVVVDYGPLMGVQGVLVESRTTNRLVVSIEILQRAVAVEIDAAWVRRAS
jgi:transcription antitermination factor NusG